MNKRDIGQEILDGVKAIKSGKGKRHIVMLPDAHVIRESMGLSQSAFAAMLGVSPRTLQDWEQGRRKPSGPALSLLKVAAKRPDAIREAIAA
ncbi:MAG: helix-turn-helix domain-containing protein [Mariprofundaceae bacterium]|nr:helix-turn-helix domain-containing protein [Mariprofundaceae bacterium]